MSLEFLRGHFSWVAHNILLLCLLFHAVVLSEPQNIVSFYLKEETAESSRIRNHTDQYYDARLANHFPTAPVDFLLLLSLIKKPGD